MPTLHAPLLTRERDLYAEVWSSIDAYGRHAPGEHYAPLFLDIVGDQRGTLLDAGCGSGKGGVALAVAGFDVLLCDLTDDGLDDTARGLPFRQACLWHDLRPVVAHRGRWHRQTVDYVYCCDVLEHIPTAMTMLVVDQLLRVTKRGLFLSVSLVPDGFGVWVGQPLHATVQPFTWWRDHLRELGPVTEARDLLNAAVFYVVPR